MKSVFLFMSGKTGFGGHHISTRDIVSSLRNKGIECWVVSLGQTASKIFVSDKCFIHFNLSPLNIAERNRMRKFLKDERFDAYFPVDETSCRILFSVYPVSVKQTVPIKPGWINVSSWTNLTSDFICFSKENYDYMKSLSKYSSVNVHLIPNRVNKVKCDSSRINRFKEEFKVNENEIILFGVSRIDPDKTSVFKSLVALYEKLSAIKLPVKAFLIGAVNSEKVLNDIQKEFGDKISIITDSLYTTNVSQLFSMSYAIVGMGRTAMESMSLGIPTFIPLMHSQLPLLVDSETFEAALSANLTYRTNVANPILKSNLKKIERLHIGYKNICEETQRIFKDNLDIDSGIMNYIEIIDNQKKNARSYIREIRAFLFSNIRWTATIIYSKIIIWKD